MNPARFLLCAVLAVVLSACAPDDPASLVASAKDYIAKGDYNASIIQLKNALQKDPDNGEARYLLGLASLESGDLASADIELNKARDRGLQSDELEVALARIMLLKGESKKLLAQHAQTRLSTPKQQAELRALIGVAHLGNNQLADAATAFREALASDSGNVPANLGSARMLAAERHFDKALTHVAAAIEASPSSADAHSLKGDLLAAQGDLDAAERAYREAVRVAPRHIGARMSLITHLLRYPSLEKADSEVTALEAMAPKDPRTLFARARVQIGQRKFAAARETLQQVLKATPDHVPSLTLAGMAAFESGAYLEAESHLRKASSRAPESVLAKRLLAATRLRLGQTDQALKDVQDLLARHGKDPAVIVLAGEAYLANGDIARAANFYETAKKLQPGNAAVQTRLAHIRFAAGDSDRGIKELESAAQSSPEAYQADLALVTTYLRQRQADKALDALKSLEAKQPNNPITHHLRGLAQLLKRDSKAGRASFEQALKLHPTYMPAVTSLARLDLREKKPVAAKQRYEAVLKKEPANEQALLGLAVLLRTTGASVKEIEKLHKQAVSNNPASARARTSLVNFYLRSRDHKNALAAAQEAQAALPNDPSVIEALGVAHLSGGEMRQAVASFARLVEVAPKSPQAHMRLARAQVAAKQPEDALKTLRTALEMRPDLTAAHREIAAIYVSSGRMDEALRTAREVQSKQPTLPIGYALEGEIHIAKKDLGSAERTFRAALKKFDHPLLAVRTYAVLEAAGKSGEASSLADDWIKRHPNDALVLAYLGERALAAKRFEASISHYRSALQRQPDNPLFLNNLASASAALKQAEAVQYAERAHELAPDNAIIMNTLGWILAQRGDRERGVELLGRAAELAPDAHNIRLNFARALIQSGQKGAARKELEQLSRLDQTNPIQKEAAALLAGL